MASKQFTVNTPDEMLANVRDFLVNDCGFSIIKDVTDDLDIATQTFIDGKLCVLKDPINKYYISIRSANHYSIWGNSYTKEEDKIKDTDRVGYNKIISGLGILISGEYDSSSKLWYNQPKSPIYIGNKYIVTYGSSIGCDSRGTRVHVNYIYDGNLAYTCLISAEMINGSANVLSYIEAIDNFDKIYGHLVFGNMRMYNKNNVDYNKWGGFIFSSFVNYQNLDTLGGVPANIPQPNIDESTGAVIFSNDSIGFVNVEYGDYPNQVFDNFYTDVNYRNCWASSLRGFAISPGSDSAKRIPVVITPLKKYHDITIPTDYTNYMNIIEGNGNNDLYDCKTFGLPIIICLLSNPVALEEACAMGELYGIYFISMYNMVGGSLHTIKTYEGFKYTQNFPLILRRPISDSGSTGYGGIAVCNDDALNVLGNGMGGDVGK